jgi:hypothetical protein
MLRMLRAVTQRPSAGPERPGLRLRHNHGGKHDVYDSLGTASVTKADLSLSSTGGERESRVR